MKYKFTLSIGYSNARREDVVEVDDEELNKCKTEDERDKLIQSYFDDWSNNYIDGWWVDDDE